MKITVFDGSPHGENGNTHVMVEEFLNGAKEAGAEVENIFLAEKHIEHCSGCANCWIRTPGKCGIKDDMEELLSKFISSDIVVFATPVYFYNVTGIMKNFMDRLIPLLDPHFRKDEGGECRHLKRFKKYPNFVVISNCGFPEQTHFQVLSLLFRKMARSMHSEVIAEICRGGGELLKRPSPVFAPRISEYIKTLRKAGKEIVDSSRLSEMTILRLKEPIVSDEQYIRLANQNWDKLLGERRCQKQDERI